MKKQNKNPVFRVKPNNFALSKAKTKEGQTNTQHVQTFQANRSLEPSLQSPQKVNLELHKNEISSNKDLLYPLLAGLQNLLKKVTYKREDLEVRDRFYIINVPQGKSYRQKQATIKRWLQKVVSNTLSIGFNYYSKDQLNYEQFKVYCSQNILKNIAVLTQKYKLSSEQFKEIDEYFRDQIITLLLKKYPLTQSIIVNKHLDELAKAPDQSKSLKNDFLFQNEITFQIRDNENYDDLIKAVINKIINKTNQTCEIVPETTNYGAFQKLMKDIFEMVQEKQKMESTDRSISKQWVLGTNLLEKKQNIQVKKDHNNIKPSNRQYREKVKQYTSYLIGKKVPQSVNTYSRQQIDSRTFEMKSPAVLRILTKWCQELWEKFIPKNYYLNKKDDLLLNNRQVQNLSPEMASNLDKLMQIQKAEIKKFMQKLIRESYQTQLNLLNQLLENCQDEYWEDSLQKVSGKFSVLIGISLQKWIVRYLNRLIHGLLKVSNTFYSKFFSQQWSCPPNLITFSIGDLMRCKCSSQQRQILKIFQQLKAISEWNPSILKIIRIKNRLNSGTNDILMNVRFAESMTCQIQLAVNSKKSKFIKTSNGVSHYLYEIQRSLFGPINQLCSIQRSLDLRSSYYSRQVNSDDSTMSKDVHKCEILKKSFDFQVFTNPFICSVCSNTYSENNLIYDHLKCSQCSFWRCGKCYSKTITDQMLKRRIFSNSLLLQKEMSRFERKYQTDELPEYGIAITWLKKQSIKPIVFKRFTIRGTVYLFYMENSKVKQILKVQTQKNQQQFLRNNLVFISNQLDGSQMIQLDQNSLQKQYFLPRYIKSCYSEKKKQINLENQPLDTQICKQVFQGKDEQRQSITTLTLNNTQIQKIQPLSSIFPNLKILNLINNKSLQDYSNINQLKHLEELNITSSITTEQLPESITLIKKLKKLNLTNNPIQVVPPSIGQLSELQQLSIRNQQPSSDQDQNMSYFISELPNQLFNLMKLEKLNLNYQSIYEIPQLLGNLQKLKSLNLKRNNLKELPKSISNLKLLQQLNIQFNPFESLPQNLSNLRNLSHFQLKNIGYKTVDHQDEIIIYYKSHLQELPTDIDRISSLQVLDVHSKNLASLPSLRNCHNLEILNLQDCKLSSLPEIGLCQKLKLVNLKHQCEDQSSGISEIAASFFKNTPRLEILNLAINNIRILPEQISILTQLRVLIVDYNQLQKLPESIGNCSQLSEISILENNLTVLPQSLRKLSKLKVVRSSFNKITSFSQLTDCRALQKLYLQSNRVKQIPRQINKLVSMKQLYLQQNYIEVVPNELAELKKMKENQLLLRGNPLLHVQCLQYCLKYASYKTQQQLNNIKDGYCNLDMFDTTRDLETFKSIQFAANLTKISIEGHKFSALLAQFECLTNLIELNISNNQFQVFPEVVTNCINLTSLICSRNKIESIPETIGLLRCLRNFNASNNCLKTLPLSLNQCISLNTIDFTQNQLTSLPQKIFQGLTNLETIDFDFNKLQQFPKGLLSCSKLESIHISHNKLVQICGNFEQLQKLRIFQANHNQLTSFPQSLVFCLQINQIQLEYNKISEVTPEIGKLNELKILYLGENKLQAIPITLSLCQKLQRLSLRSNLIEFLPRQLCQLKNIWPGFLNLINNPIKGVDCKEWVQTYGTNESKLLANTSNP